MVRLAGRLGFREPDIICDIVGGRDGVDSGRRRPRKPLRSLRTWRAEEDATVRAGVEAGESWDAIVERLPGRNGRMARYRASRLGVGRGEKRVVVAWTEAESAGTRAGVAVGETSGKIAERLPGRTVAAVRLRRAALKEGERRVFGHFERWTEVEDEKIRAAITAGESNAQCAERLPGRSLDAVQRRREALREGEHRVVARWGRLKTRRCGEASRWGRTGRRSPRISPVGRRMPSNFERGHGSG
jgi:hypothetical protein